ncbi:MAG TPA: hypothetical protein DD381_06630 [Lentisphaeria bacterium]|nr:MAG: hypothetical protein A2X47_13150 [Lentisphaerae bacterium GWF2_38_69]HBM16001.1 hypothetical protein [Lentisphaeria bacterium]
MDWLSLNALIAKLSRETVRQAEAALEECSIIFSVASGDDAVYLFKSSKSNLICSYGIKEINTRLSKNPTDITFEELSCLMHYHKFHVSVEVQKESKPALKKPNVAALEENRKDKLLPKQTPKQPSAEIFIHSKNGFPNASSVWEKWNINLKIFFKGKEYIGNTNKLRQLRFESEGLSTDLSIHDFDSQSRQIIRFITQYAEPDGNGFSLKSDLGADFFHSLIGFKNIYFNEQKIIIHGERASITAIPIPKNPTYYKSALMIGTRVLSLVNPLMLLGKSGLWVGEKGEYWWINAYCDLVWLRSFILSEKHSLESIRHHLDLSTWKKEQSAITKEYKCKVQYKIDFFPNNKKGLVFHVSFKYGSYVFGESDTKIEAAGSTYIKRDKEFEQNAIKSLLSYGIIRISEDSGNSYFSLCDTEGIGLFVQYKIIDLLSLSSEILITPSAAKLIYSSPDYINFSILSSGEEKDSVKAKFKLYSGEHFFKWKELIKASRENRTFVLKDGKLFKLDHKLGEFLEKADEIALITANELTIAINSVIYWVEIAKDIADAIPAQWLQLSRSITAAPNPKKDEINLSSFKGTLRYYQIDAVMWMKKMILNNCNVILADEMGLGKTLQTLALIQLIVNENPVSKPFMVVCPTSLIYNWEAEAKKFVPDLKILLIGGGDREQLISDISNYKLIITSYAVIKRDIDLYKDTDFELLILDEAQHIKNSDTLNARVCKQINAKHKIVLTGTPLENSPEDIWSIFDFLNSGTLGSRENFKQHYFKIENDIEKQAELASRIKPFILRRKKIDVEQLPEKTEQILFCEMNSNQRKVYNEILYKGRIECDSFLQGKSTRFNVLSSLLRLRQLCCHPLLLPDFTNQSKIESAKTDLLNEIICQIIDSGHRTLVFSQFTSLLSIIKKWCSEQKIPFEYLDGNTKDRIERVNHFNKDKNINLFLLSLKAGGIGLNLTGADTVIIYDPWWNPSVEAQATDRTHRIGQVKPITTIKLVVKDSIEEKILDLQKRKQNLFNGIVESPSSFSRLTDKDIQFLLE